MYNLTAKNEILFHKEIDGDITVRAEGAIIQNCKIS